VISATEAVTISAGEIMKKKELKEHLGMDPVHLTAAGYAKLAEVLLKQAGGEFTRAKRKADSQPSGKKVSNLCNKRQKWLMEDDTAAQRHYNQRGRGNNSSMPRRPYRGRGGLYRGQRGQRGRGGQRGGRFQWFKPTRGHKN
jgi:hypothetical protein